MEDVAGHVNEMQLDVTNVLDTTKGLYKETDCRR